MTTLLHSSDSHVYEPADLFTSRVPAKLRPSAMRWEFFDGGSLGGFYHACVAYKTGDEAKPFIAVSRPSTADGSYLVGGVEERVQALDFDGVGFEVLHPNLAMSVYNIADPELSIAQATVFNDYMAETYAKRLDRFVPIGCIPMVDVAWAVREIERCAELGLKGVMLPIFVTPYYWSDIYEPVWATAQATGLPITFHAATGFDEQGFGMFRQLGSAMMGAMGASPAQAAGFRGYSGAEYGLPAQKLIATLVGTGVCERYPELKFVSAENSADWLASLMGIMDKAWLGSPAVSDALIGQWNHDADAEHQPLMRGLGMSDTWPYPLRPSEYVRRQVRVTFIDDAVAIACREVVGKETIMWSADYPHPESSYPQSRRSVEIQFADVSDEDKRAICGGNLARLYGLDLEALELQTTSGGSSVGSTA